MNAHAPAASRCGRPTGMSQMHCLLWARLNRRSFAQSRRLAVWLFFSPPTVLQIISSHFRQQSSCCLCAQSPTMYRVCCREMRGPLPSRHRVPTRLGSGRRTEVTCTVSEPAKAAAPSSSGSGPSESHRSRDAFLYLILHGSLGFRLACEPMCHLRRL